MIKYKNKYIPNRLNKAFWKEVLVGRKIKKITFDKIGIKTIHLDSGEVLYFIKADGGSVITINN